MNKKIFRSSFLVAILVLVVTVAMIMGILYRFIASQTESELKSDASYIAYALETEGVNQFNGFENTDKRVTIVDFDGTVVYDSEATTESLDNHATREEIQEAMATGAGLSSRYSDTLAQKTVYYAIKLDDCILRVSTNHYSIMKLLLDITQPVIGVIILAVLLCIFLSMRVSKSITEPINSLDLDNPQSNEIYEELTPLLRKIAVQKKKIQKQLIEADKKREEFNLITENMSEGFLVIDKETSLLTHNTSALRLLGIDKIEGGSVLTLCRVKAFRDVVEKALSGERAEETMAYEEMVYDLIANPVFENKKVIGAVIVIIDVTESENREKLRREFTANVSHELKTPLTSVSGFAELMKNGGTPDETVVDFSTSIYNEAQRLISLVNDIIKISELDGGNASIEKEPINLHEMAGEILTRLEPVARKKNVNLNLLGKPAEIMGARKIVDEMIYNLCENAIKYNKDGGQVDITVTSTDTKIDIAVRDTGIGIPMAEQPRVFERFYRVDKSHSKSIDGTGLGLAIVKHGAMYHNAEVKLDSAEGVGTCVTISFEK